MKVVPTAAIILQEDVTAVRVVIVALVEAVQQSAIPVNMSATVTTLTIVLVVLGNMTNTAQTVAIILQENVKVVQAVVAVEVQVVPTVVPRFMTAMHNVRPTVVLKLAMIMVATMVRVSLWICIIVGFNIVLIHQQMMTSQIVSIAIAIMKLMHVLT